MQRESFLEQNLHTIKEVYYQVSDVLCLWRVAGVEAVPGCAFRARAGGISWARALWRPRAEPTGKLRKEGEEM